MVLRQGGLSSLGDLLTRPETARSWKLLSMGLNPVCSRVLEARGYNALLACLYTRLRGNDFLEVVIVFKVDAVRPLS